MSSTFVLTGHLSTKNTINFSKTSSLKVFTRGLTFEICDDPINNDDSTKFKFVIFYCLWCWNQILKDYMSEITVSGILL